MVISRRTINQMLACSPVIIGQFLVGMGFAWTAPTLLKLKSASDSAVNLTLDQLSWLASIHDVGKLSGPFIAPFLADNLGRKPCLAFVAMLYCIVWSSTIFARNLYAMYAARILFGLANGIHDVVAPVYTTENCAPKLRGIVGSMVVFSWYGGIFFEYVVASYTSYAGTAVANMAIAGCMVAVLYFATESPYFLAMKRKLREAEENLNWLSGDVDRIEVVAEVHRIENTIQEEKRRKETFRWSSASRADMKSVLIMAVMHLLQVGIGTVPIGTYASLVFVPSGSLTSNEFAIMYSAVPIFVLVVSSLIVERVNRRRLVIGGYAGVTVGHACVCVLMCSTSKGRELSASYPWMLFAFVTSFISCSSLLGPAFYALKGELLPFRVRVIGNSVAVTTYSIVSFWINKTFLLITEKYGMETNFLIYGVDSFLLTVFLYCVLPETRGKTLHELQKMQTGVGAKSAQFEIGSDVEKRRIRENSD